MMISQQKQDLNYTSIKQPSQSTFPVQPTAQNTSSQSSSQSTTSRGRLIYIGIIAFIAIFMAVFFIFSKTNLFEIKSYSNKNSNILADYSLDMDTDGYPDFVETKSGLDPKISEYLSCNKSNCESSQLQQSIIKRSVLIVLDNSDSMQLGTPTRMEIAKQAIKNYVTKASSKTNIGLMIYGHKGSNSISCTNAEIISKIGTVNGGIINKLLNEIKPPVELAPVGFALQQDPVAFVGVLEQALVAFAGKVNQNNEIILLTDGEETCDPDPIGQATSLKSSNLNIKINVIGFAVDDKAQTKLDKISTSGGGSFFTANNLTELEEKFNYLYENELKRMTKPQCKEQDLEEFRACYKASFQKVTTWVTKRKVLYNEKKITKQEYDILNNLNSQFYKLYNHVTSKETQNFN